MDIFIDSSALISIIIEIDTNYKKANAFINSIDENRLNRHFVWVKTVKRVEIKGVWGTLWSL